MPFLDLCAGLFSTVIVAASMVLFTALLVLALVALVVAVVVLDRVFTRERLKRDAGQLGLSVEPGQRRLIGQLEGLGLAVRYVSRDKATWYEVSIGGLPRDIGISRESIVKLTADPEVGDIAFDRAFFLDVAEDRALAVLTPAVRAGLSDAIHFFDDHVQGGVLTVRRRTLSRRDLQALAALARQMVDAAAADPDQQLLLAIRDDPVPGVRTRALRALLRRPPSVASAMAAKRALEGRDPGLRAMAALHLEEDGTHHLQTLLANESLELVAWLLRALDPVRHVHLLPDVVSTVHERLLPEPEDPQSRRAAVAAARFLGTVGDGAVEDTLLALLGWDHVAITVAAAQGLGRVGTPRAVVPLKAHTEGLFSRGDEVRACREAIDAIQGRIGGHLAGGLSVASGPHEAGALSLAATGDEGALSLAEGERLPREPVAEGEPGRVPSRDAQPE